MQNPDNRNMSGAAKPRVVALVPKIAQPQLRSCLEPVVEELVFLPDATQIAQIDQQRRRVDVLLMPVSLLHEQWKTSWHALSTSEPRCAILVYSPHADFRLWSEALELGCYDLIVEPLDGQRLRDAVCRAFESTQTGDS